MIGQELDPASRSLAEALKVSFRVLGAIMAVLVVVYLFSGLFTVASDERAVVLRVGRLVGAQGPVRGEVLKSGLHFSWPYPVDEVIKVSTSEQSVRIDTFWHYEAPQDATRRREEIRPVAAGLRPGYDGALMTGDRGLIHVKWLCQYQVPKDDDKAVLDYVSNVADVQGMLQDALENASIRVAATYQVETIWRSDRQFVIEVRNVAQKLLNGLRVGIQIRSLQYGAQTPPLQTLQAFRNVTASEQFSSKVKTDAERQATETKLAAAGNNWEALAKSITKCGKAKIDGDLAEAERHHQEIGRLLMDKENTSGQARKIISEAEAYRTAVVQRARQGLDEFQKLLPAYKANPELTLSRRWTQAAQEILSAKKAVKIYVPGGGRYVLNVTLDPNVIRRLKRLEAEEVRKKVEEPPK